jgi:NADH dehydrogenase/NADH:ubiquinone oxidoreductase subunit G
LTAFKDAAVENADVLLPITPFTETSGTFVNAEGRAQSFHGVVKPLGDARPAWKVLRVLGNLLGLDGFAQESSEEVRAEALGDLALASRLDNTPSCRWPPAAAAGPRARGRRADLCRRLAGAPRAVAAADRRRAAAVAACRRRCGSNWACSPATRCWSRRARRPWCCRRGWTPRWPPAPCACRPATRPPRRWARCSDR